MAPRLFLQPLAMPLKHLSHLSKGLRRRRRWGKLGARKGRDIEYVPNHMVGGRRRSFFVSGGTLPPNSASYIERSADKLLLDSLLAGHFCYVLNPRQVGKSSLSVHAIDRLAGRGVRTAFIDLTRIGWKNVTAEQWYSGLAFEIARELDCRRETAEYWRETGSLTPVQRFFGMLREVALDPVTGSSPLVIFIDEIDVTRSLPFDADEFFAAIRECFNRRVSDDRLEKLTFCLLGVAVPSDLIRNRAATPFNIGERITLEDFTEDELSAFARELGPKGLEVIARVYHWTGGQPFLSQSLCRSISGRGEEADGEGVDAVVHRELFDHKARDSNINLADVANIVLHSDDVEANGDAFLADILSLYQRVLAGKEVLDDDSNRAVVRLKLSGIVRTDSFRLYVRNRIYKNVFDRRWIEEHMPEQELRRQSQSYRRGIWRSALVTGAMLTVVGVGAISAWQGRQVAVKAQERLNYELYVSDMNSLRLFYENGDTGKIEAILDRHRTSPYRGFEWGYWLGRYHDASEEYTLDYKAPGKRERGKISRDGSEICLMDDLSRTATILDRTSKHVLACVPYYDPQTIVPLQSRWAQIDRVDDVYCRVVDIKSGRLMCRLGDPDKAVKWVAPVEHSDLVATGEGPSIGYVASTINIWNAESGKKIRTYANPWKGALARYFGEKDLFALSRDGRYLLGVHGPLKGKTPDGILSGEAFVTDLTSGKVIDRFLASDRTSNATPGFNGKFLFLFDNGKVFVRDILRHRSTDWDPQTVNDWRASRAAISGNTLIALTDGGGCVVQDLTKDGLSRQGRRVLRENVFSVETGSRNGQYIASSNSVRLYDAGSHASAEEVWTGNRVTRYAGGIFNIFGSLNGPVQRVKEDGLRPVGQLPKADGQDYTYNGRWYLRRQVTKDQNVADLMSVDGSSGPVQMPFPPDIWSCGRENDSIAAWRHAPCEMVAYSGKTGKVRWRRDDIKGVNSVWVGPDGSRLFVASEEQRMTVYDMKDGRLLGTMDSHNVGPINLTFSADGRIAFTCGGDGRAVMWDTVRVKKLMEFRGNEQLSVSSADISPDGRRVLTTNRFGSWQLWDASNGVQLLDVHASSGPLSSALFCADGRRIVTAGDDGQVRIWRTVDSDPTTYVPVDAKYLSHLHL